jgi:hypothetical protein
MAASAAVTLHEEGGEEESASAVPHIGFLFTKPLVRWSSGKACHEEMAPLDVMQERAAMQKLIRGCGLHLKYTESVATKHSIASILFSNCRVLLYRYACEAFHLESYCRLRMVTKGMRSVNKTGLCSYSGSVTEPFSGRVPSEDVPPFPSLQWARRSYGYWSPRWQWRLHPL